MKSKIKTKAKFKAKIGFFAKARKFFANLTARN